LQRENWTIEARDATLLAYLIPILCEKGLWREDDGNEVYANNFKTNFKQLNIKNG
jgi:hypothetical protein